MAGQIVERSGRPDTAVRVFRAVLGICLAATIAPPLQGEDRPVSFQEDIKPILEARCVGCHGGETKMSKLDLRTREGAFLGGTRGPVIVNHRPEQSYLFLRVSGREQPRMPMGGELSEKDIEGIRKWIEQGAPWDGAISKSDQPKKPPEIPDAEIPDWARRFWAFQKPVRSPIPKVSDPRWSGHPVDAFLRKSMSERGLEPAPMADRRTLVRRAYLDLIGLPPTPEEVDSFVRDDSPNAWEELIDRLLDSPHYGERWGRHWLDVARYADSNGYEHDFDRPNAWRYRDYVIRAFNKDTPYDVFLKEQIAGDELEPVTYDCLIATGFLRSYSKVGFREKDNPQFRFDYLDDMIATIGRGVLGLTVQCARCHDHKFDPISQKDYYRLQASLFTYVEVDHPLVPAAEAAAFKAKTHEIEERLRPLKESIRAIEKPYRDVLLQEKYKEFPENVQTAIATPEERRTPGQVLLANQVIRTTGVSSKEIERDLKPEELAQKRKLEEEIHQIEEERPEPIPVAMGITDGDYRLAADGPGDEPAPGKGVQHEKIDGTFLNDGSTAYQPPPSYFLYAGDMNSRGPTMKPGFPRLLTNGEPPAALPPEHHRTSGRRLALVEWLVSPENPLTARVFVNRIWHHHFGRGIVATIDNFGKVGDRPTHPELLDWLAVGFQESGWSLKRMHRLLMTSQAYRMSSSYTNAENIDRDPENLYLWQFRPQRLEAEIVRDSILAVSGSLDRTLGGLPVFPPLPEDVLRSMKHGVWKDQDDGPEVWRRSVYVYRKRGLPFPFFEVFDLPDQNVTCGRRNVSTVPTQALTLMNNEFVIDQAKRFAHRLEALAPDDRGRQLELAYQIALGRPPREEERLVGLLFLEEHSLTDLAHVLLNLNEFVYLR